MRIIGNTVGTTTPKPNFKQTDPTKGDYIKGKPNLKSLAEKDIAEKTDLSFDVQSSLDRADIAVLYSEQELTAEQQAIARANIGAASLDILNIDYNDLAFDTTEIVVNMSSSTTSVLGQAILGQMILA